MASIDFTYGSDENSCLSLFVYFAHEGSIRIYMSTQGFRV